jgi:3-methylcrotonyl-CoA carboxylase alpha subunit/geranyl-CoA carboxylase alpha subunit
MRRRLRNQVLDARLEETAHGPRLSMDGRDTVVHTHITRDAWCTLTVAGRQHRARWARSTTGDASHHVQIDGIDAFITDASYEPASTGHGNAATQLKAPFNGRVAALHASVGQTVAAGQTLLVIESMKLEHAIAAPRAAVIVSVAVEAGQQVSSQQLLMGFE